MNNSKHIVYEDELNSAGRKTKAGKNKKIAQEFGINYTKEMFEFMKHLENQGSNFKWETFGECLTRIACASLFTSFTSTPKNLIQLEEITKSAVLTEWEILLNHAKDNNIVLPVANQKNKIVNKG